MSSQPMKKMTLAQVRAEKERRVQELMEGYRLSQDVAAIHCSEPRGSTAKERYDRLKALLPQASRACELLQHHSDVDTDYDLITAYGRMLLI